jgi:RHS repeat-associated protein
VNYTYDSLGQLKTAFGYENGGAARLHEKFGYLYDAAGTLSKRTNNALIQTLGVNSLNQLTTGTRSGTLTVAGTTTSAATNVTVNSQTATRYGDNTFAREGFALSDGNNAFTAVAADNLGRLDTNTVTVNLPSTVNFAYDQNGNLTGDGRRMLAYDDENQLESVIVTNGAGSSTKSEFSYDGLFRRRVRKEYTWSSGIWNLASEIRYIYDGRLVLQERDANNLPTVTYTRGVDLSGSREGAGGIGGLLARTDNATGQSAFYHADGNGNITSLVNGQQLLVARYTYDPFGNTLSKSGPLADANLYRFSSKEYHQPSGLVYYLYRFYDPNLQRWLNRDPIGETGGINLYGYAARNPLSAVDPYGLRNYVKCCVGTANVGRGVGKGIKGGLELAICVPALIAGPETGPFAPLVDAGAVLVAVDGTTSLVGSVFLCRRGAKQLGEAIEDPDKGHFRNLLGLLPFGGLYDDPGESLRDAWNKLKALPWWKKLGELFTW